MMKLSHMTAIWKKKKKKKKKTFSINYSSTTLFAIFEQGLIQQPEVNKLLNFFHQV